MHDRTNATKIAFHVLWATVISFVLLPVTALADVTGFADGLSWRLISTPADCHHDGHPDTWCDESDRASLLASQGIEERMVNLIRDPSTKFAAISYFAFSSPAVADALCEEAESRALRVVAILHDWPVPRGPGSSAYKKIFACSESLPTVTATRLGARSGLHHAKIFLVANSETPFAEEDSSFQGQMTVTVSSANLSYKAVGLHLENWLWLSGPTTHEVMKRNWCFVQALPELANSKREYDRSQKNCLARAGVVSSNSGTATTTTDETPPVFEFLGMPATAPSPKALKRLIALVDGAKKSIKIAAHIFTAARDRNTGLVARLIAAANRGVRVELILDDDTEMVIRKLPGWTRLRVGSDDIEAVQTMLSSPVKIRSVDTNERSGQLHHHKFMVFDDTTVWTGSGNFTASSLAGRNSEQFYVINDHGITTAHLSLWNSLWQLALPYGTSRGNPPE